MAMLTRLLIICIATVLVLLAVLLLGRGGMEAELALVPALNTPAFILRSYLPFWFVPLSLIVFVSLMVKVFSSESESERGER